MLSRQSLALVSVVALLALQPGVRASEEAPSFSIAAPARAERAQVVPDMPPADALRTRQFRISNARVPGSESTRQDVFAWQVRGGSWNGQVLDGLSVVLVRSMPEDGRDTSRQCALYVSHFATTAQRSALVDAFFAAQPQLVSARDMRRLRIEPAIISIDIDGNTVILHIGQVA